MKKLVVLLGISATLALPVAVLAQAGGLAQPTVGPPAMATLECRAAQPGEKSNATAGSMQLVCKKIDMAMMHEEMAKMSAADQKKMMQSLMINWDGGLVSGH